MHAPIDWAGPFIGLPYRDRGRDRAGVDCWGLLRLIYRDVLCIALPGHDGQPAAESAAIERVIGENRSDWREVAGQARFADGTAWRDARPFDGLLIRHEGYASHVGVLVRGRQFIHAPVGRDVRIDRGDGPAWRHRIVGLFRHVSLDD